jgi:Cu/Ag efflux pump CusA
MLAPPQKLDVRTDETHLFAFGGHVLRIDMIGRIVTLSLKFRVLVLGTAAVVMALSAVHLQDAPIDALPEFTPPQVQIQTEALGLSAAEVEQLITVPIEHDLLNGIAWLDQIRSESEPGLSSIDLIFKPGTDPLKARQVVQERMTQAHALPNVGTPPVILPPVSSASRVMMIGLSAKDLSLIDLSVLARWKIKPRLMGVPGVANVTIWGQRDRQLQVQVDPARLRQNGVTLSQVISSTGNALWVSPLTFVEASTPGTGGFIDTASQRLAIQHVSPITTAKGLAAVAVEDTGGRRLRLDQVSTVVEDHQPLIGDAILPSGPGLMLVIEKFPEANTGAVTEGVEQALEALRPGLSGVQVDTNVYQAQSFIDASMANLGRWAIVGAILLFLFLALITYSWRIAMISFVSIASSLVTAAYALYLTGTPFNVMVLAGLAVALCLVIDDVLVNLAEIRRRLRQQGTPSGLSPLAAVAEASAAVRTPLLYAMLILLLAPLPFLFLGGVGGAFSRPAILAYALAVLSSTAVAVLLTPVLAFMLLPGEPVQHRTSPPVGWASRLFERTVPRFVRRPRWAYATVAILLVSVLAAIPQLAARPLLPSPQDRSLLIHWQAVSGTSVAEMARITRAATKEVSSVNGVRHVGAHVGRAVTSDQVVNVNSGEIWVTLSDTADYTTTVATINRVLRGYPGVHSDLVTYPQDRVRAAQTGTGDALLVRLYGPDLGVLHSKAQEVQRRISTVQGVVQPKVQTQDEEPTLEVETDLAAAERYGLNPGDIRRTATTVFSGLLVGNLYEDQKVFDVVVVGKPSATSTPADLADVLIDTPSGDQVRLGDIAKVRIVSYPTIIKHDATLRSVDVTAGVRGRDLGAVLGDIRSLVQSVQMPLEYHAEVLSDAAQQQTENLQTAALAIGVVIGIFLLLQAALSSWRLAALLFTTLPLAGAGAVLAASLVGGVMTLGALLGLFTVLALAVRNGIGLISSYRRLESSEGHPPGLESILSATRERAAPVLLTAGSATVVLLPLLFFGNLSGAEILFPLAAVTLGGLVTSTLLTLFVLPALYVRFSNAVEPDRISAEPTTRAKAARGLAGPTS